MGTCTSFSRRGSDEVLGARRTLSPYVRSRLRQCWSSARRFGPARSSLGEPPTSLRMGACDCEISRLLPARSELDTQAETGCPDSLSAHIYAPYPKSPPCPHC